MTCPEQFKIDTTSKDGTKITVAVLSSTGEVKGLESLTHNLNSEIKFQHHDISLCFLSHQEDKAEQEGLTAGQGSLATIYHWQHFSSTSMNLD